MLGLALLEKHRKQNFFFLYGCRPSAGVKADTKMVRDIYNGFIEGAERINFMIKIPETFDFAMGSDA